jgi:hypothetical protein
MNMNGNIFIALLRSREPVGGPSRIAIALGSSYRAAPRRPLR